MLEGAHIKKDRRLTWIQGQHYEQLKSQEVKLSFSEVFTLPHIIQVDSSGLQWTPARPDSGQTGWYNAQSTGFKSSPVHSTWTLTGLQATFQSPVKVQSESTGIHWSPVESSGILTELEQTLY